MSGVGRAAFALSRRTQFVLGTKEEGCIKLLNPEDKYPPMLAVRERQARTKDASIVDARGFQEYQAKEVQEWSEEDVKELRDAVEDMRQVLERRLPRLVEHLPEQVTLHVTSGSEETGLRRDVGTLRGRVGYCRGGGGVYLSRAAFAWSSPGGRAAARHLVWHELWHIVSRNLPPPARHLVYAVYGFVPLPGPPLPHLSPHRLSNPDAMLHAHYVRLGGRPMLPLLFLDPSWPPLTPEQSMFEHMFVLFAELSPDLLSYLPRPDNPKATMLHDVLSLPDLHQDLFRQIGRNTNYLLHVEEVVAENFAMLALQEPCADPAKLEQLNAVLQQI